MARSSNSGPLLLVLLGILVGGGTWNYMRNAELEQAELRNYRGYSQTELEALRAAYAAEVDTHSARYRAAREHAVRVGGDGTLDRQVDEFERVQRISQGKRAIADDYAKNQVRLEEIDREIALRQSEGTGWLRVFRRITTLP
jgi:hypothetical protein